MSQTMSPPMSRSPPGPTKKTLVFDRSQYCPRTKEIDTLLDVFERIHGQNQQDDAQEQEQEQVEEQEQEHDQDRRHYEGQVHSQHEQADRDRPRTTQSQVVFVKGPSGTGKSSLVEEFHDALTAHQQKQKQLKQQDHQDHQDHHFFFVTSKFDEVTQQEPFFVIFDLFNNLCRQILHDAPPLELKRIRRNIPVSVKTELNMLTKSIPNLLWILTEKENETRDGVSAGAGTGIDPESSAGTAGDRNSKIVPTKTVSASALASKVKYLLVKFLKCVCSSTSTTSTTTVMVVDDIQWANQAVLDLISFILTDASINGLLFIGCYRQEYYVPEDEDEDKDKDEQGIQAEEPNKMKLLGSMFNRLNDYNKSFVEIQLKTFTQEETAQYVARVLDAPNSTSEIDALSETLWWKTEGNPFFITSYLQLLVERDILTFDLVQYKWTVQDQDRLDAELDVSDNVVQVVLRKLQSLRDKSLQRILFYASFLPSTFHINVLKRILQQCCYDDCEVEEISLLSDFEHHMETLVMKGLLSNVVGSQTYSFAHDRIQQASMELIGHDGDDHRVESKRKQAMRKVGLVLASDSMSRMNGEDKDVDDFQISAQTPTNDWMLYAAIATLEASDYDDADHMIQLLTIASRQSKAVAAYAPAAMYADKAVMLLREFAVCPTTGDINPDDDQMSGVWSSRYGQCLELYLLSTEMHFTLGHYQLGNEYCQAIFDHARNERDKLLAFSYYAEALSLQKRPTDALVYLKKILNYLGEYPRHARNPLHLIVQFYRTRRKLKQTSADDILALPIMTDPDKLLAMRALSSVIIYGGFGGRIILAFQSCLAMFRLTFQHGLAPETATAFVSFAMLCFKAFDDDQFALDLKSTGVQIFRKVPNSSGFVLLMAAM